MGIRLEREHLFRHETVIKSLKFYTEKKSFTISGKINKWDEIEFIARTYYRHLEELLYSKEIMALINKKFVKMYLKENDLLNKTFFEVLCDKNFQSESMKLLLMEINDYVFHNVVKRLPNKKELTFVSGAVNELLENTLKYSSGEFFLLTKIQDSEYPLKVTIENKYESDDNTKEKFEKLSNDIDEVNSIKDSSKAIADILKKRSQDQNIKSENKESRLGYAKIRVETGAIFKLLKDSEHFGKKGISIELSMPIKIHSEEKILENIKEIIKQ